METLETRPEITSLIKTVSQKHGIHNHVITDVKTNQKGEGYLGQIFMVTVKDEKNGELLEMIIKAAFIEEKVREMAPIRISFQNEINFYTNVYPSLQKFEKARKVLQHVQLAPKCFGVSLTERQEMLALENLKSADFQIFDKKLILDDDHVKLIFKTYGRFHGYSFALRDQEPEEYARIVKKFYNVYEEFTKGIFVDHMIEIGKVVESTFIPEEDDVIMKKYEKYTGKNLTNIFNDIVTEDLKYSTILHGDCWSNNMMFKYEDTADGKRPTDMRLIDFQLIKVGSPVCDLSYCLYSGASKKVFDNLNEYLQIYYDSFSSFVRELGSDPEKLFPFHALKEHWKSYSKFGMIMSFAILKMKLTDNEDLIDFSDDVQKDEWVEVFKKMRFNEEDYSKRIRGLLWHMFEVDAL